MTYQDHESNIKVQMIFTLKQETWKNFDKCVISLTQNQIDYRLGSIEYILRLSSYQNFTIQLC